MSNILSIAPYKYLKPKNGGHWGVFLVDEILSVHNNVFTLGVEGNEAFDTSFTPLNKMTNSRKRYLPFAAYATILSAAQNIKAQYLFCHHPYLVPAAQKAAKKLNIPLYIRSHNIEAERFKSMGKPWWRVMQWYEKKAYRAADKVFFVSEEDALVAQKQYGIEQNKTAILPFPITIGAIQQSSKTKEEIAKENKLNADKPWLIFMGDLKYIPNDDAVKHIVQEVYPRLKKNNIDCEILICGKGLSDELQAKVKALNGVHYLGFVDDLQSLLYHSHVMLNPLVLGAGVKTKVVESLGWNLYVVSTFNGAIGINRKVCGQKLVVVGDGDWDGFVNQTINVLQMSKLDIPKAFFDFYYSQNIANNIQSNFE